MCVCVCVCLCVCLCVCVHACACVCVCVCEAPPSYPIMYDVWEICAGTPNTQFKISLWDFTLWDGSTKIPIIIIKTVRLMWESLGHKNASFLSLCNIFSENFCTVQAQCADRSPHRFSCTVSLSTLPFLTVIGISRMAVTHSWKSVQWCFSC